MIGQISASNQLRTSSELAPNMFGASSDLASVMEFGFYFVSSVGSLINTNQEEHDRRCFTLLHYLHHWRPEYCSGLRLSIFVCCCCDKSESFELIFEKFEEQVDYMTVMSKSQIKSHTQISNLSRKVLKTLCKISNFKSQFFLKSPIFQFKFQIKSQNLS